jgi:hypothetical protein
MIKSFLEAAATVNSTWSMAAFAIAAILALFNSYLSFARQSRRNQRPAKGSSSITSIIWGGVVVICFMGALPILANTYLESQRARMLSIFHVRVIVVDSHGVPVSGAALRTAVSNETTTTEQGVGAVAIPQASLPADGKVTIYADLPAAFLHGRADIKLAKDPNPTVTIELSGARDATATGMIQDDAGRALAGATVSVLGGESTVTAEDGSFTLKANAAAGQTIRLHAEKKGYQAVDQYHPAGTDPVTIVLPKEPANRRSRK